MPIITTKKYDLRGNVVFCESKNGNMKVSETIKYDAYGRVILTTPFEGANVKEGAIVKTEYDKRKTTVKKGRKKIVKEFDSWGNPTSVNDGECKVTYKYSSNETYVR